MPSLGKIVVTPEAGFFDIPVGLDYTDVDLIVNGIAKSLGPTLATDVVKVEVASGASGSLTLTLPVSISIAPQSSIVIKIGKNATHEVAGDMQARNPILVRSYAMSIKTFDASQVLLDDAKAMIAVVTPVSVGAAQPISPPPVSAPAGDGGGSALPPVSAPPSIKEVVTSTGTVLIDPYTRGSTSVRNTDGSSALISLDAGSVNQSVEIRIVPLAKNTVGLFFPLPSALEIAGSFVYSLSAQAEGIPISAFLKQANLTLNYTDANAQGLDERTLKIYRWEPLINTWASLPSSKGDFAKNSVSGQIQHSALFALLGEKAAQRARPGDLNGDGKVDLVDFSILLYNWGVPKNIIADINQDGKVDLVDFSILLYWWTG